MGSACTSGRGSECLRRIVCSTAFALFASAGAAFTLGVTLVGQCISELFLIFAGQTLLLLLWVCCRRPRTSVTWGYVFLCSVILVRETILVITGGVPCGLATERPCQESHCVEYSRILWTSTSCRRRECLREFPEGNSEAQKYLQVHAVLPEEIHTTWLMSGHICVWCSFVLSVIQLLRWHAAARGPYAVPRPRNPTSAMETSGFVADHQGGRKGRQLHAADVQQPISLIIACPLTYGLCAVYALRKLTINRDDAWSAEAMINAAELYSSIALYAFQRLLVLYIDQGLLPGLHIGGSVVVDVTAVEGEALELRHSLQRLVAMGIKQYIFLAFLFNSVEVSAKVWNWWRPSTCTPALARIAAMWFPRHRINITVEEEWAENQQHRFNIGSAACADLWNVTSLLMVVADFFTCSIALFAIWTYERTFADFFHPMKPFWKFWGVKGMLSVGWLQAIVLMLIGFLAQGGEWSDENFRTFVNYHLVCVEAFLLALLNVFAYPPTPPPWACANGSDALRDSACTGFNGLEELDPDPMELQDLGAPAGKIGKGHL